MVGRRRKTGKSLPPRVYVHHGSYRYVPKSGPKVTLAKVGDYGGMLRALAQVHDTDRQSYTLGQVMDRYLLEVTPNKSPDSARKEPKQIARLRAVFGHMRPDELAQADAFAYYSRRAQAAATAAKREIELFRHICTKATQWGEMRSNPLLGIALPAQSPRKRYVTNDEYLAAWELAPAMIRAAMDLAMLTGLRRGDILGLERADITDDGLRVRPGKTRKSSNVELLFEWSPDLSRVIRETLARPPQVRQAIISGSNGKPVPASTFGNAWARLMRDLEANGIERFQFRDLRRKSASDEVDADTASARLGHSSRAITDRVYRVKPRKVRPLK